MTEIKCTGQYAGVFSTAVNLIPLLKCRSQNLYCWY